jgi:hypothetical protein
MLNSTVEKSRLGYMVSLPQAVVRAKDNTFVNSHALFLSLLLKQSSRYLREGKRPEVPWLDDGEVTGPVSEENSLSSPLLWSCGGLETWASVINHAIEIPISFHFD